MAKAPTKANDPKVARKAAAQQRTAQNKAARLARHVKAHENDKQAAKAVGKPTTPRKAPSTKGNFRKVNKAYRDGAGRLLPAPTFPPIKKGE